MRQYTMWKSTFRRIDPLTRSTAAGLFCSIFAQKLSSEQPELWSEILCWVILPVMFRIGRRLPTSDYPKATFHDPILDKPSTNNPRSQRVSSALSWIFALGIVAFCFLKAENRMARFFPILTPFYLVVQVCLGYNLPSVSKTDALLVYFVNTVWGAALMALFVSIALSDWNIWSYAPSIILVGTVLFIYVALNYCTNKSTGKNKSFNIEGSIFYLSWRILIVLITALAVEILTSDILGGGVAVTLLTLGILKALAWYFMIQIAQDSSWRSATAIGTFGIISIQDPFRQTLGTQALSHVVASLLALGQLIHILPRQATAKSFLWGFSLVTIIPYLANNLAITRSQTSLIKFEEHPITLFMHNSKETFEALLQNQSKTYAAAYDEYRRRYSVDPPPGFEAWYEFAKSNQSPIIDEFDMIYDSISPLWKLSGKDVLEIMPSVQKAKDSEVWLCDFSGHDGRTNCSHPSRTNNRNIPVLFNRLFEDLGGILPNVKFLVNHFDEPRVLVPPQAPEEYETPKRRFNQTGALEKFILTNMAGQSVWNKLTSFCSTHEKKSSAWTGNGVKTFDLPFITDPVAVKELCQNPGYETMHGLIMSPSSFRLIEGIVPVLSTGSLSTMGDILFPSPAYIEPGFRYDDTNDIEWELKRNNLYWAGSTTGGYAKDDRWKHYHRQRFVKFAQNLEKPDHYYLRDVGGEPSMMSSSFLNSRLFDVGFTRVNQCEEKYCRDQEVYFDTKSWAHKDQALQSRLVFDLDGNGISGRYYKLLASRSAVLKQTIIKEWHDERLVPWVHYIPVSQSMEELAETVVYLTASKEGQKMAREIAEQGRDWFSKAFRDVDMAIYTYRLLLELARLQDPSRPAN